VVNFTVTPNINFNEITALRGIKIWGEVAFVPVGKEGNWDFLVRVSEVMLLFFIVDAAIKAWLRGPRTRALMFGMALSATILCAAMFSLMFTSGDLPAPMTVSMPFMCIILLMGYELSQDLVQVKKLSVELQKNKNYLEHILTSIPDAIFSVKMPERILEWARDTYNVLGYEPEECIGKTTEIFYHSHEDYKNMGRLLEDSIRKGDETLVAETDLYKKSGVKFPAEINLSFYKVDKDIVSITGLVRDISARKNSEKERMQLRQELTHYNRVVLMNELSTNLAHEINQPLGAILNNASAALMLLSRSKNGNVEFSEIIEDIINDANRAAQVIRNIKAAIKKETPSFTPLNLNDIINDVAGLFKKSFADKHIILHLDLQPDLELVNGDRVSLQQVLINLIANGLQAMREDQSGVLRISSSRQPPELVAVGIRDSGKGINAADKEKIFKPFYSTKKGGIGMGLHICRSILEEHEGRMWFENNPDGGATFYFSLPAYKGTPE
jgi:PAS domain S-box-containing protein